ncbi:MAG: hypothetical protein FJZ56_06440, partial [Chlamydiae bacterium]|nr:hypothetical protein [Chlamydiota bacterium]
MNFTVKQATIVDGLYGIFFTIFRIEGLHSLISSLYIIRCFGKNRKYASNQNHEIPFSTHSPLVYMFIELLTLYIFEIFLKRII